MAAMFVVTKGGTGIDVVDRYQERVTSHIDLGRKIAGLRMDALGRYLLAHPLGEDSAVVVALGTNRVIGSLPTEWRADLPFVAPDGGVALAQGKDVIVADGETLRPTARVRDGAADFWYPFQWTGFRPRAASLDQPVEFAGPPMDSTKLDSTRLDSTAVPRDSAAERAAAPTREATSYTVSFAALLAADKARDLAAQIRVGSEGARVVTSSRDGATIYRVIMGPYATRDEAERVGRDSKQSYWVYEGGP